MLLCALTCLALSQGVLAGIAVDKEFVTPAQTRVEDTASAAPEPNTTLLAGLGGLALLFFALRRK